MSYTGRVTEHSWKHEMQPRPAASWDTTMCWGYFSCWMPHAGGAAAFVPVGCKTKVKTLRPAQHSTPAQSGHRTTQAARRAGIYSSACAGICALWHFPVFFSLVLGGKRCPQQFGELNNSKLSAACRTGLLEVFPLQVCNLIFSELDLDFCISS